jgi:hypothetical protein
VVPHDLATQVPKWWLPDAFAFIDEVPKTSTGKFDKKRLREWLHDGTLRQPRVASSPSPRPRRKSSTSAATRDWSSRQAVVRITGF